MADYYSEKIQRYHRRDQRLNLNGTFAGHDAVAFARKRERSERKRGIGSFLKCAWFIFCLVGLMAHSFLTTELYMNFDMATETVIEMPTKVKPPALTICFPIWDLVHQSLLPNNSKCFAHLLTNRSRITSCASELLNNTLIAELLYDLTADPLDYVHSFWIRQPSKNGTTWINKTQALKKDARSFRGADAYKAGCVMSFYKGPYKCVRFNSMPTDTMTLAVDRMTTGYPRSRNFFMGYFNVSQKWTDAMKAVRLYVHENGTFPRGEVTLPVVANLSKALSFVVTYTRIETHYLPSPYEHNCMDYTTSPFEDRMHCISTCVRRQIIRNHNALAWDDFLMTGQAVIDKYRPLKRSFISPYTDYITSYEPDCSSSCSRACVSKVFYTTLSETSPYSIDSETNQIFQVDTRFENPETSVRFVPRLDFQAYVIYIASVFGIWFSASIYHLVLDLASCARSGFRLVNGIHGI